MKYATSKEERLRYLLSSALLFFWETSHLLRRFEVTGVVPNVPILTQSLVIFKFMKKGGVVYIMANQNHTVFYSGVTSDLISRVGEHKAKHYPKSCTARYNIDQLVYFEPFHLIEQALERDKQIKKYRREKKFNLIFH